MTLGMVDSAEWLSNPIVAFLLRAALGSYVVWMARGFYADPMGYFRQWMPRLRVASWMPGMVRGWAAFCIWGGCFIVLTAIATQLLRMHGAALAIALIVLAAIAAWFLTPKINGDSEENALRRVK